MAISSETTFDRLRQLVAGGEPFAAAEGIRDLLRGDLASGGSGISTSRLNEISVQFARLNRLHKARRLLQISAEDFDRDSARIDAALLEMIDDVERLSLLFPPVSEKPVQIPSSALAGVEKIIGPVSQLRSLAWIRKGLSRARAVCRVRTPSGTGSGFLVGGGYLLTNHHVIPTRADASSSEVDFNFEDDESGKLRDVASYSLDADSFITSMRLDCTAVKVISRGGARDLAAWGELTLSREGVDRGDNVVIIQHPQGGIKQICLTDNKVVNLLDDHIQYTTDTMPGSSGAPVFDDRWLVVAIHHQGGNLIASPRGGRIFANQGVRIRSILSSSEFCRIFEVAQN
ncbi:trypsin-like peptidase domain-containing protein [Bradyrhizobium sp. SZCCHNRI3043]|uniref:trypsin-like peptidase domain-containing protein n=1 Tax=Bradyrhizobium sp. SZCCHNRI3043 TaxID=3057292 RepID=UPI0028EAE69C|nr:trypsin-like peptidase domain-containing protein [Bradyrhizobium sp. SZCCHNRI3043]